MRARALRLACMPHCLQGYTRPDAQAARPSARSRRVTRARPPGGGFDIFVIAHDHLVGGFDRVVHSDGATTARLSTLTAVPGTGIRGICSTAWMSGSRASATAVLVPVAHRHKRTKISYGDRGNGLRVVRSQRLGTAGGRAVSGKAGPPCRSTLDSLRTSQAPTLRLSLASVYQGRVD